MPDVSALVESLKRYGSDFQSEISSVNLFLKLLSHPDAFERTHIPGHITGSALVVSPDRSMTLLVHHIKLDKWLQPGGHADGDRDVARVALREANEETGHRGLAPVSNNIFDIDIHTIPARRDFPKHDHYDIRYLIEGSPEETIVVSNESHDVKWVGLSEIERYTTETSILRMRDKVRRPAS
jgi:8-oxo-dGTP pyrophosphatase MutT (NUDIX family)